MTNKLYSKEQIEEWASKRADDAGRLSRQLLDTMRENERLRTVIEELGGESDWAKWKADTALSPHKHSVKFAARPDETPTYSGIEVSYNKHSAQCSNCAHGLPCLAHPSKPSSGD